MLLEKLRLQLMENKYSPKLLKSIYKKYKITDLDLIHTILYPEFSKPIKYPTEFYLPTCSCKHEQEFTIKTDSSGYALLNFNMDRDEILIEHMQQYRLIAGVIIFSCKTNGVIKLTTTVNELQQNFKSTPPLKLNQKQRVIYIPTSENKLNFNSQNEDYIINAQIKSINPTTVNYKVIRIFEFVPNKEYMQYYYNSESDLSNESDDSDTPKKPTDINNPTNNNWIWDIIATIGAIGMGRQLSRSDRNNRNQQPTDNNSPTGGSPDNSDDDNFPRRPRRRGSYENLDGYDNEERKIPDSNIELQLFPNDPTPIPPRDIIQIPVNPQNRIEEIKVPENQNPVNIVINNYIEEEEKQIQPIEEEKQIEKIKEKPKEEFFKPIDVDITTGERNPFFDYNPDLTAPVNNPVINNPPSGEIQLNPNPNQPVQINPKGDNTTYTELYGQSEDPNEQLPAQGLNRVDTQRFIFGIPARKERPNDPRIKFYNFILGNLERLEGLTQRDIDLSNEFLVNNEAYRKYLQDELTIKPGDMANLMESLLTLPSPGTLNNNELNLDWAASFLSRLETVADSWTNYNSLSERGLEYFNPVFRFIVLNLINIRTVFTDFMSSWVEIQNNRIDDAQRRDFINKFKGALTIISALTIPFHSLLWGNQSLASSLFGKIFS